MKKIIACICLITLVMSFTYSAFAWYSPTQAFWFDIYDIQCVNTQTLKYWDFSELEDMYDSVPYKFPPLSNTYQTGWNTSGRIYVYHTVTGGGGNAYTNLFHAVKIGDDMGIYGTLVGQKWVTPQMWIPIEGSAYSFPYDCHYSVAVRGNTKHYENYSATSVDFYIGVEANQ